jgi:CxxC-x17-CxxC domain-containing protein
MSASDSKGLIQSNGRGTNNGGDLDDKSIACMDCKEPFIWTVGEQIFFRNKNLLNPPKRCKACKLAKNQRLEAIEAAQMGGKRQRFEVKAECARCSETTTVPFYPSQGRPVYCRACYIEMRSSAPSTASGSPA